MPDKGKGRGRRQYADDFRQRVLAKLASGETSLRIASKEFGVSVPTLIKWRKEEHRTAEKPAAAATDTVDVRSMQHEIEKLRDEAARLREERDRLRRSIAHLIGIKVPD